MKKTSNFLFIGIFVFLVFNVLLKNQAEADAKKSYESYQSGNAIFVDVREESEVKDGMIKGAHWIPLSKFESSPKNEIDKLKQLAINKEIFIYCRSGNRAGRVQNILKEAGLRSVNLGGYSSLVNDNLSTQTGPR